MSIITQKNAFKFVCNDSPKQNIQNKVGAGRLIVEHFYKCIKYYRYVKNEIW